MSLKTWLFHSSSFCCCIPVRAGFVLISILTFLLSGAISIIIWFEVTHSHQLSTRDRVAFLLTGIVESLLFLVSTLGFVGVVARKQLFVVIYAYFLCVHFAVNIIIGVYFLVTIRASNRQQFVDYCAEVFVDTSVESTCLGLTRVSTYVFIAVVAALLLLELYGVLIAIRYVYRLRTQKRDNRSRRLGYFHALSIPETPSKGHMRQGSDNIELLHAQEGSGDPRDPENALLDTRPQNYIPVSTYDRDLPPTLATGPSLSSSDFLSDTSFGRRVRALPSPPVADPALLVVPPTSGRAWEKATRPERLPNPHEPPGHIAREPEPQTPDSDGERRSLYTAEVSSTTHSALMDHASYMRSVFVSPSPAPKFFK